MRQGPTICTVSHDHIPEFEVRIQRSAIRTAGSRLKNEESGRTHCRRLRRRKASSPLSRLLLMSVPRFGFGPRGIHRGEKLDASRMTICPTDGGLGLAQQRLGFAEFSLSLQRKRQSTQRGQDFRMRHRQDLSLDRQRFAQQRLSSGRIALIEIHPAEVRQRRSNRCMTSRKPSAEDCQRFDH